MNEELKHFTKADKERPLFKEGVVLLVDKPTDWTSFNAVSIIRNRVSKIEKTKRVKVGHAGTLDPLATGLLIICVGKYTKKLESFVGMGKRYSGTIQLGGTRPSYDMETEINQTYPVDHITDKDKIEKAYEFVGEIMQKPPIFSAIRVDGERLYKKARRGEEVEIKARPVTIDKFDIKIKENHEVEFVLDCSKGTYVRSLAYDYGKALGSGAYLSSLRRDKIGKFDVKDAWDLKELVAVLESIIEKEKDNVG